MLKGSELFRVEIELFGVSGKRASNVRKLNHAGSMCRRVLCDGIVDLFQVTQQTLCFCKLRENGIICFREFVGDCAGQLDQPFAVTRQFVAFLNFFFFARNQVRRLDLGNLMTKQIELLSARCFRCVERGMFRQQRLQLLVMLSIFLELLFRARERIEQTQLRLGREQRLVIVRPVKIDQFIADILQDRQRRRRAVDELTIGST